MTTEIKFECSNCGQRMLVDAEAAGMAVNCPHCSAVTTIPKLGALHDRIYDATSSRTRGGLITTPSATPARQPEPAKDEFPDPEICTLRQELIDASVQTSRLEGELTDARGEAEKLRAELKAATKEQRALQRKFATLETTLAETLQTLDTLRAERETLATRLQQTETARDQTQARLREREAELADESARHVATQTDRTTAAREVEALKLNLARLEADLATARAGVAAGEQAASKAAAAEREASDLRIRLALIQTDLTARQAELAKSTEEAAKLRSSLAHDSAGRELVTARDQLATLTRERDALTTQIEQLGRDLARHETDRTARDEQIKTLRSELDEARRRAEAAGEVRLRQDNEVLRGIIARQNTELEQKHTQLTRLKRARLGVRLAYAGFALVLALLAVWAVKAAPQLSSMLKF